MARQQLAMDVALTLTVDARTRAALIALGWTPPDDQEEPPDNEETHDG